MVTIGMNYRVLPGKEAIFENAFRKVVHAMRSMEAHRDSKMCRDIDDPQHYVILSEWSDEAAFEAFIGSETFKAVANWGKEQILAARPSHTFYRH